SRTHPLPLPTLSLHDALPISRANPPFAEVAEGRFFCFFFLVKKRKVLKVLWFWSALPTASQSTHFMNIKYSVLYFTWKLCRKCRSEEHTSELQSRFELVCRLL